MILMTALRKTTLSLFIIGFCNTHSSIAGTMGPVKTGCSGNRLFAGAEALYLQPRNDDLDYTTYLVDNYTKTLNTHLDYDWGFRLYGGVKFANNNDITIAWQRLHTRDNDMLLGNGDIAIEPRWLNLAAWASVQSENIFDYDEVSGVFAHTHDFNNAWLIRYGAGAEYAEIDSRLTVNGIEQTIQGHTNISNFQGFGPRIEADVFYNFYREFNVFASANSALLIGSRDVSLLAHHPFGVSRDFSDRNTIVPKLGLRIGLDYQRPFGLIGDGAASTIDFQVGWQAETYIDAIERPSTGLVGGEGVVILPQRSNYSNQGLFFGMKLTSGCL